MSEKRYIHTIGVAKEAIKLADMYGEDAEKAYIAALLHDIAKEMPNSSKLAMAKAVGIKLDEELEKIPTLLHGYLGAQIAKTDFGIDDEYVLDAIRYHTTGRANMTLLEKIIYLADIIEPNREIYEGLPQIRQKAFDNLDEAVYEGIIDSISYVNRKGEHVYYLSEEARDFLKNEDKLGG
ncbi:MAG: bis(5'-nucleosyl)-tetraphosphatase (symmetrical) YqeK [Defluviitaleaceae bacterium]|nr:bis(5'-nucleosyl)-tetraphosphatase (symmetrical) YqeK [Defluviitaleaceae bacterium]